MGIKERKSDAGGNPRRSAVGVGQDTTNILSTRLTAPGPPRIALALTKANFVSLKYVSPCCSASLAFSFVLKTEIFLRRELNKLKKVSLSTDRDSC